MDKRVLLVEDDEHKKFQILNFIQTNWADMSVRKCLFFPDRAPKTKRF